MGNQPYDLMAKCKECKGIAIQAAMSREIFTPVCPICGEKNEDIFEEVAARKVYKGKWYNPLTWSSFEWEVKE